MYNLMIVEDDRFYRYEIANYLPWEEYGFTICAEAINGRTAMEQMAEKKPDVIFTDISMPEMNGIELIRRVREQYPYIQIVVLSSYSDFTFVKDAMKLGAMDYILKHSMQPEDVIQLLTRIREKIGQQEEEKRKAQFFHANFSAVSDKYLKRYLQEQYKAEDMAPFWEAVGYEKKPDNLTLLLLKLPVQDDELHRRVRHALEKVLEDSEFIVSMDADSLVILLSMANEKSALRILEYVTRRISVLYGVLMDLDLHGFSMGVSDTIWNMQAIHTLYSQADLAQAQSVYDGYDKTYFYCNVRSSKEELNLEHAVQELSDLLHEGQIQQAREGFTNIIESLRKTRPDKRELQKAFFMLSHVFYRVSVSEKMDLTEILGVQRISERWCESFKSLQSMEDRITSALDALERLYDAKNSGQQINSRQAQAIMNYIEKNYMKELSLDILADEFCLTPNYLCKVFKSGTGIKLTQYINQVRIAGAKKLMRQTNLRSHEIAEMVGFSSASYYSTIFKQVTGMTVSEYKDSILQ